MNDPTSFTLGLLLGAGVSLVTLATNGEFLAPAALVEKAMNSCAEMSTVSIVISADDVTAVCEDGREIVFKEG